MKSTKTIIKSLAYFAMFMAVITTAWSCTGNANTADAKDTDSSSNDNTMSTNANDQDKMMNDSAATINNGKTRDAAFMMKVAEINSEEIKLGKLAQQKGTMKHVKELGKMMVTEHEQAMADLGAMAKTKMVTLPTIESEKIIEAYKTLNGKTGKAFDKAYSDIMVDGHKEAIALFENTARETKDADVKAMTTTMIPKLKSHLEHAEMCKKECEKM